MRRTALLMAVALTACKTVSTTTTTVSGTPVLRPAPAPAAPASAPASAAAFSPAGKWVVGLVAQGTNMEVQLELVPLADGGWTGTITSTAFPPFPITKATLTGKRMVATFAIPTGDMATMTLDFDGGDLVEGEWTMAGDGSKLTGKRR